MKTLTSKLLGSAALVIVLGLAPASAQVKMPDAGGGAQVQGGAEGGAQMQGGAQGQAGTQAQGGGSANIQGQGGGKSAQGGAKIQGQGSAETGGSAGADTQAKGSAETQTKSQAQGQAKTEGQAQSKTEGSAEGKTQSQAKTGSSSGSSETKTEITSKQKTEIKQYFTKNKVSVKSVEVSKVDVSIGVAVPSFVVLHPLPPAIVVSAPADCPYHYFVWGDDIVIVESCNRTVVEIIVNIA